MREARHFVYLSILALMATACSGSASTAPGASSSTGPSATESTSPASSSTDAVDTAPFVVAWASTPDEVYTPLLMAIDSMKSEGFNVSAKQLADDNVQFQALASNDAQTGPAALIQTANAVKAGVDVKAIAARAANSAVYVAANDYKDCSRLAGKPVGVYSPQAAYTVWMDMYFTSACPGMKYTSITIPDSPLRAQALEQGQILATTLGLPDATTLVAKDPGKFYVVPYSSVLPGIGDDYILANNQTISSHPSILQAWVVEQLKAIRSLYQDSPSDIATLEAKYFPESKDDTVLAALVANKVWYANGGLDGPGLASNLSASSLTASPTDLVDSTFISSALSQLGKSDLTKY